MNPIWSCVHTLIGHSKEITLSNEKFIVWGDHETLAISPDGQILATADRWGNIKVRNTETWEIIYKFDYQDCIEKPSSFSSSIDEILSRMSQLGSSYPLTILPDRILVCTSTEKVKIWNLDSGELLYTLPGSGNTIINLEQQLIVTQDICFETDQLLIQVWNLGNGELRSTVATALSQDLLD